MVVILPGGLGETQLFHLLQRLTLALESLHEVQGCICNKKYKKKQDEESGMGADGKIGRQLIIENLQAGLIRQ